MDSPQTEEPAPGLNLNFSTFKPPNENDKPEDFFEVKLAEGGDKTPRWIRKTDSRQFLVFIATSVRTEHEGGGAAQQVGWAFMYRPGKYKKENYKELMAQYLYYFGWLQARVGNLGYTGEPAEQTGNRAALRALYAALIFRSWEQEGASTLVIATNNPLLIRLGQCVEGWAGHEEMPTERAQNKDLWGLIDECMMGPPDGDGVKVQIWPIKHNMNVRTLHKATNASHEVDIKTWADGLLRLQKLNHAKELAGAIQ
ncbi:hypothetical protein EJ08DRAFT_699654 [Tothia fuscella]|uniref:RNase H type-1 domain-containing protein n=1 Tax=Tothia fuscella TaxID=1048955 RepID=A0A9P4TWR4_9PEZI|nr:hypothetical protein EJ08DRAFT_699654 [Tothia fuscella]